MSFSAAVPCRDARILVVEDHDDLRYLLTCALEVEGYEVTLAVDGSTALESIADRPPDLVLLDIVMPVISGLEVLEAIRRTTPQLPVILLSGLCAEENRVRGLRHGADDYVVKPFSTPELIARVDALLRRANAGAHPFDVIEISGMKVDRLSRQLWLGGELVELTAREFDLLAFLAAHPGRVYTRETLLRHVWGSSASWQTAATVTEHVYRLRAKLAVRSGRREWITTVRGVGYRFERRQADQADEPCTGQHLPRPTTDVLGPSWHGQR
jgi:two-component system phosphate regulon response regulator PhoB